MTSKILLLDCSDSVREQLLAENFEVSAGQVGFVTGTRHLPYPIYEADVIVYNPSAVKMQEVRLAEATLRQVVANSQIFDCTPSLQLSPIAAHIKAGAILLVFVNDLSVSLGNLQAIYSWIPCMPILKSSHDSRLSISTIEANAASAPYQPVLDETQIQKPVKLSLEVVEKTLKMASVHHLITNQLKMNLSCVIEFGNGRIVLLPTYKSNDDIILDFIRRVLCVLRPGTETKPIVQEFRSPDELALDQKEEALTAELLGLQRQLDSVVLDKKRAERVRIGVVTQDDVAKLLINYFDRALQEPKYALIHLYKIVETIESHAGGEKNANFKFGCKAERKLIGKIANASYGDERHAPKSAEVIKPWSQAEISECFVAARKILIAYFGTLF